MIILVSSVPIDLLKNYELEAEESPNPPHVYSRIRRYDTVRNPYIPKAGEQTPATYHGRPVRRYEPSPIAPIQRSKKHLYLVADEQKKEED